MVQLIIYLSKVNNKINEPQKKSYTQELMRYKSLYRNCANLKFGALNNVNQAV